ncbi:unnamed protein product, partial [marine sediment metagenome]
MRVKFWTEWLMMKPSCTKNKDVGLIKIRSYRPFPYEELRKIVQDHNIEKLILLEKSDSLNGMLPPFSTSIATALYPLGTTFRS